MTDRLLPGDGAVDFAEVLGIITGSGADPIWFPEVFSTAWPPPDRRPWPPKSWPPAAPCWPSASSPQPTRQPAASPPSRPLTPPQAAAWRSIRRRWRSERPPHTPVLDPVAEGVLQARLLHPGIPWQIFRAFSTPTPSLGKKMSGDWPTHLPWSIQMLVHGTSIGYMPPHVGRPTAAKKFPRQGDLLGIGCPIAHHTHTAGVRDIAPARLQ